MSVRVDSALIASSVIVGNDGLGVLAENVPSTGEHGAGYLYNDLSFPADNGKEVRGEITRWPAGTLFAFEDSSFTYTGSTDFFEYQLYVDGVATGSPARVDLIVGGAAIVATQVTQTATASATAAAPTFAATVAATQTTQTETGTANAPYDASVSATQTTQISTASATSTPPGGSATVTATQTAQTATASGTATAPGATVVSLQTAQSAAASASATAPVFSASVVGVQVGQFSILSQYDVLPSDGRSFEVTQQVRGFTVNQRCLSFRSTG